MGKKLEHLCDVTDLLQPPHPVPRCRGMLSPSGNTWEEGRGREREGEGGRRKEEAKESRQRKKGGGRGKEREAKM